MTLEELSHYNMLKQEIGELDDMIRELAAKATQVTQQLAPGFGGSGGRTADHTAVAALIADAKDLLRDRQLEALCEYNRLTQYISSIRDPFMRRAFTLRFVRLWSWTRVAMAMGGGNTPDGVRKAVMRYIRRNP